MLRKRSIEDLNMEDEPFAYSKSGNVLKGVYNSVLVAIKFAPCNFERNRGIVIFLF